MLLQGMVGGWAVIEASHTVSSGLNVTCHMLNNFVLLLQSVVTIVLEYKAGLTLKFKCVCVAMYSLVMNLFSRDFLM